jgi:LEA14-like dessication related protein
MKDFVVRVRIQNGSFVDIPVRTISVGYAINMVESQYGKGSYLGIVSESYV